MSLTKYRVELEGFPFTTYVDNDGNEVLEKPASGGKPTIRKGRVVEAHSPEEAQGIFMREMNITSTERNFKIEEVKEEEPKVDPVKKAMDELRAEFEAKYAGKSKKA